MSEFEYEGESIPYLDGDTVLDALLREEKDVAFSCKKGTCLSCMRKGEGPIPDKARIDLTEADRTQGMFLMCQTPAQDGIRILADTGGQQVKARIKSVSQLSKSIYKIIITPDEAFDFKAGQFVNFQLDDGLNRSYSIASLPEEKHLEFHIRHRPDGQMSSWLCKQAKPDDTLMLKGPHGQCHYSVNSPEQPILMVGTSSGLAPLYGIVQEALQKGHSGDIYLYHGSRFSEDIYYVNELKALSAKHPNLHYRPCVSREYAGDDVYLGRAADIAKQSHNDLKGWKVYLCGSPAMVQDMQQSCFVFGANLDDILTDPFELMDRRRRGRGLAV